MTVGIAQHHAARVSEAQPACGEVGFTWRAGDWPRRVPCPTTVGRIARRFGWFRRWRRPSRQADLAIVQPKPISRPADCLPNAITVNDRNEVERVALLAGAKIAPNASLRARQMDTETVACFTGDRTATPLVAFAMTCWQEIADELVNATSEHKGDVGRLHAAVASARRTFSTRRCNTSICFDESWYRARWIDRAKSRSHSVNTSSWSSRKAIVSTTVELFRRCDGAGNRGMTMSAQVNPASARSRSA